MFVCLNDRGFSSIIYSPIRKNIFNNQTLQKSLLVGVVQIDLAASDLSLYAIHIQKKYLPC